MSEVIIVKAVRTCISCPSQWDAWDLDGNYWYLRYRSGRGSAERQPGPDLRTWTDREPNIRFEIPEDMPYGGSIDLPDFCERAGLNLALDVVPRETRDDGD